VDCAKRIHSQPITKTMKPAQRIAFGYYTTKFKALGALSPQKAAQAAFTLFCTPYHGKPKRKAPEIFSKAVFIEYEFEGLTIRGFHWKNSSPQNKRILICHGFDSCCYRFDAYIPLLQERGFEVFAFDAPGHGISDGKTINALLYSRLILTLEKDFGPFEGIMAHSLGGLALAIAMEKLANNASKKIVLIAPATETGSAIRNFLKYIPLTPKVEAAFYQLIYDIGKQPADWFSVTRAVQHISAQMLWLHDQFDPICAYEDTKAARKLKLPNLQFFTTKHLGHSNIHREPRIQQMILSFFMDEPLNFSPIELEGGPAQWM